MPKDYVYVDGVIKSIELSLVMLNLERKLADGRTEASFFLNGNLQSALQDACRMAYSSVVIDLGESMRIADYGAAVLLVQRGREYLAKGEILPDPEFLQMEQVVYRNK